MNISRKQFNEYNFWNIHFYMLYFRKLTRSNIAKILTLQYWAKWPIRKRTQLSLECVCLVSYNVLISHESFYVILLNPSRYFDYSGKQCHGAMNKVYGTANEIRYATYSMYRKAAKPQRRTAVIAKVNFWCSTAGLRFLCEILPQTSDELYAAVISGLFPSCPCHISSL